MVVAIIACKHFDRFRKGAQSVTLFAVRAFTTVWHPFMWGWGIWNWG